MKGRQDRAVAAVAADSKIGEPHVRQGAAQLAHRRHRRVRLGHLPECPVGEFELPGVGGRPGNAVRGEPVLPAFLPETAAVEHAIVAIDLGDQFVLDSGPMPPQQVQRHGIDRDAVPLDRRRRLHEASAQQGARHVNARQHGRQQALQQQHVAFAIAQDLGPIVGGPRTASQDAGDHALLGVAVGAVDSEMRRGGNQAGALLQAIGAGAEFGEQVEDESRLRPAQRHEAAELGAGVIGNQHRVGVDRERRLRFKLAAPQPPGLAAAQFFRHHADRPRPFTGAAGCCRRIVAAEFKLEIDGHDMLEGQAIEHGAIRRATA